MEKHTLRSSELEGNQENRNLRPGKSQGERNCPTKVWFRFPFTVP